MKQLILSYLFLCNCFFAFAVNVTIIESQSSNPGHIMDDVWLGVVTNMGHTGTIVSQTILDNNTFFATTDILIVSSGIIALPPNRIATILQFIQSGKPVYLQSEYLASFTTNQAFASIVNTLGASFTWNNNVTGDLTPMNVLGTYATTNNTVTPLSYFWYSISGADNTLCSRMRNILEYGNEYHGFHYIPLNTAYGTIITTTDQDWVRTSTSLDLMENFITHLITPPIIMTTSITVNTTNTSILCNGGNGTITITASGGNGGYQYSVDGGATYQAGNTFSVVAGTYNISVKDVNNCTATDTITLTEPSMMVLSNYVETCAINGTTYVVSFDVTGGTGTYSVSGTTGSFSGSTFTSNAIPTGTSVNITVSDANGCALPVVATVGNCSPAVPCNTTTGCYLSNLILDGDFENFNPATPFGNFSSSYDYYDCDLGNSVCVNGTTGQNILCQYDFAVETGTPACNNTWSANIADHTTGTGNMMLVDFPVGLSAEIWGVDVTLLPNTTYCFGAHFMNLVPSGTGYVNPVFRFEANGSILGNSASIPEDEQWHYEGIQFNSGAGGLVHLSMFNQNFGALGYDMAIDDIMVREVTNGTVPITVADAVNICDNQGVITFDVLGNDTGTGINSLQLLSYPAFSVGNATADFATGSVTFVPDASFAGTTSFTYQITTNLGCSAVGTINLTEVLSPAANISGTTTFCQNVISNLDAGAGFATYNWTTPVGTANTQTVLASASGTYQLIVTNANNCADTTSTLVTINPLPTPNITGTATAICAGSFTTLDAGAGYAAYSWFQLPLNTLGNAQTQLVNSPATYGVGVIDANGCQNIDTINIGLNANPVVTITPSGATTFCPGASVDLDAGAGWNSYSWSSIPLGANGNGQVFTANSTADFIATVTNGFGCIGADTITVTVIDNVPPVITNCPANISQSNDANVCGAIVNWTPLSVTDNCTFNIVQTSGVTNGGLFPIGTTNVSYDVTDAGGNVVSCAFTVTINDTENPVITNCPANIVVSNDANVCGANVSWANLTFTDNCPNGIITQTAGVANGGLFPVGTTNVSYTATDASGNTATCSFTVTVNDTENPVISNCPANMNLNAAANQCGAVANWTNPTVSDNCSGASISQTAGLANGALFPLGTTTVTYTATDAAGNSVVCYFTVTVTDNTAPTIVGCPANINLTSVAGACSAVANWTTPSVTDNCAGATIIQTAGNSNGTLFALGTTTVTYLATDANGNTATCSFTVTVTDNVAPVIAGCPSNIVLTNGAGLCGAIATWTNPTASDNCTLASFGQTQGLPNGSLFPLGTTTIQYTAVDAGGNSSICSFTVTVSDTEAPVIAGCPSNIVQQATQGCSTPVTWNTPTANDNCSGVTLTSNFNSGDLFAVGTTTVTYTATDAVGNTSTCSFNVTVTPPPAITLSANVVSQVTCNGFADGSAMVSAIGGTGLYNYSWLTIPPQISATATGLAAGTYTVFVIDANAPACVDTQFTTVTLTQPNPIVVTATVVNNSTCEQANASAIVAATGGSGNYVYEWNSTPPQNTALATGLLAGTYTATVTDVVNGACNASASVNITTTPVPVAMITPSGTTTICEGTTTTFTATGGNSYMWIFNGNLTSSGNTFIAQQAGDYQVIAYSNVNQVGCADTSEVNILVVNPAPSADILPTNTNACEGETVTLTATGEGNIDWLLNGVSLQNSNNPISVSTSGNYQVVRSNNCGSATSTSVLVQIHPNPVADFSYEPQAPHVGDLVVFADKSISGAVWAWDFGNNVGNSILQNPTYIYVDSGYYTVSMYIEDIFGCKDSAAQTLFVSGQPTDFIPNIFSPNNDGEYDDFIVEYGNMKLDHFQVFDRWGNRVFITQNPAQTWNGNNENGAPCSAGVYFYAVQMKDAQGKEVVKKGNITLIR